jgi:hypothetical protein
MGWCTCDRLANRLQAFDKMGNFKKNIDIPWKNYTTENETFENIATRCGDFPALYLGAKIGQDFGGFSRVFPRPQSAVHLCRQSEPEGSRYPGSRHRQGRIDDRPRHRAFFRANS